MCGDVRRWTSTSVNARQRALTDVDVRPLADVNVRWRAQCEWAFRGELPTTKRYTDRYFTLGLLYCTLPRAI